MAYVQKILSKKSTAGKSQVLFLIAVNRQVRFRYKTGCFVEPEHWNAKGNDLRTVTKATKLSPATIKTIRGYKASLDDLESKVMFLTTEFPEQSGSKILASEGKEEYWMTIVLDALKEISASELSREMVEGVFHKTEQTDDKIKEYEFFKLTQAFLSKRKLCKARINAYNVMFRSMARYEIFLKKTTGVEWSWSLDDTTRSDMEAFFDYFRHEREYRDLYGDIFDEMLQLYPIEISEKHKNQQMKDKGDNYMACVQKRMKAFWNWALKNELTRNNPFIGFECCKEIYGTPFYITIEERNKVAELDLSGEPVLAIQRDIFVFQCLIGSRVGDLMRLTPRNVVDNVLIYTPRKTKDEKLPVMVNVPLSQRAMDIIEKYKGIDRKGRLLPFVARTNYNEYIKEILEKADITRMVNVRNPITGENEMKRLCDVAASHMARRTFVGNAYNQVRDPNIICKMSGHVEGSKAFARYRNIEMDVLIDVIKKIQ